MAIKSLRNVFDDEHTPDFLLTIDPTDGQILLYDATNGVFVNTTFTTDHLSDVQFTAATDGDLFVWNSGQLVNTSTLSKIDFDGTTPSYLEGRFFYDSVESSFSAYIDYADVTLNMGEEQWLRVRNDSGVEIFDGAAVYITGAIGKVPTIALAQANMDVSSHVVGLATHTIVNNSNGIVTVRGIVRGLDTASMGADGVDLYLSETEAGKLQTNKPDNGFVPVGVATVVYSNNGNGRLLVIPHHPLHSNDMIRINLVTGNIENMREYHAEIDLKQVLSKEVMAQPGSPTGNDAYIIPAGATGADWSTFATDSIAHYYDGTWREYVPIEGKRLWISDEDHCEIWNGTSWMITSIRPNWAVETTTYTAVDGDQIMANTSSGAWTLTLPASPSSNDSVEIVDYAGSFAASNLIIARNGSNIQGAASDLVLNTDNAITRFTYIDATQGWKLV